MVMADNSCSKDRGFESQRRILDGHFFTLICCKNCIVCLKKTVNKQKEAGVGPFLKIKKKYLYLPYVKLSPNQNNISISLCKAISVEILLPELIRKLFTEMIITT